MLVAQHDKLAELGARAREARVQRRDVRGVVREMVRRERAARAVGQRDEERGKAGGLRRGAGARLVEPAHDRAADDGADRRQRRARRAVVGESTSKMLGGASQIVSMIHVKCNGT